MVPRIRMPEPPRLRTRGPLRPLGRRVALAAIAAVLALAWTATGGARPVLAADDAAASREAFVKRLEAQVEHLRQEALRLAEQAQERSGQLSESAKEELERTRERLIELTREAQAMLEDARAQSDENWQQARPHLRESWEQLRQGLRKLLEAK